MNQEFVDQATDLETALNMEEREPEEGNRFFDIGVFPVLPGQVVRHELPAEAELWQVISVDHKPYAIFVIRQQSEVEAKRKAVKTGFLGMLAKAIENEEEEGATPDSSS